MNLLTREGADEEQYERGFDEGLRAAHAGVLCTEADWPQARKDGYAAGWRRGNGQQETQRP